MVSRTPTCVTASPLRIPARSTVQSGELAGVSSPAGLCDTTGL